MVDVVVNNVMALSTNPDLSTFLFKDQASYFSFNPDCHTHVDRSRNTIHIAPLIGATLRVNRPAGWAIRTLRFLM